MLRAEGLVDKAVRPAAGYPYVSCPACLCQCKAVVEFRGGWRVVTGECPTHGPFLAGSDRWPT